ncbi:hypothetical protein ACFVFH_28355 [Streptomyces sp. NPDC057697]|uniref:hypothetical protein n=1 Tax=Streptomyces sp. NPDC057697 TaxID=3346219 RepID=UPI0036B3F6E1
MPIFEETVAAEAIREAERTVINAKWHWYEEQALAELAARPGLTCTPLIPGHPVIQVVAYDGRLLGRVRRRTAGRGARWVAVPAATAHEIGPCRSVRAAARALAREAGRPHRGVTVHMRAGDR